MKNLIKRLGSGRGRGWSMSSSEDGSSDKLKQPVQHRISKRISRRQQQDPKDINRRSQQRQESRSDSKSPGHRNQHHYQQSRRESGIRDLFQFSSSGEQTPQRTSRQQRHHVVSRTSDASYDAQQQQQQHHFIGDNVYYDENQHHFLSYNHHHQQYQHEHYQRDFEPVGLVRLVQSTSPLSFYGPGSSPDNGHISRPPPQQNHHHHQQQHKFEFDSDGVNFFTHDEDNGRVRFLSSSSSVSSSVSEEPSQVHMMAGCGQSVASSSCMSGSSSYYLNSKGDLAIFGKAMRGAKHDDEEHLRAMGLVSTNQDETTSGRTSPEHPSLPRMRNEQFEARSESEYHDVRDEEIHHDHALPSSVSAPRASAPSSRSGPPSNDRMGNQEGNEMKNEFSITSISKWSSSYIC